MLLFLGSPGRPVWPFGIRLTSVHDKNLLQLFSQLKENTQVKSGLAVCSTNNSEAFTKIETCLKSMLLFGTGIIWAAK